MLHPGGVIVRLPLPVQLAMIRKANIRRVSEFGDHTSVGLHADHQMKQG